MSDFENDEDADMQRALTLSLEDNPGECRDRSEEFKIMRLCVTLL